MKNVFLAVAILMLLGSSVEAHQTYVETAKKLEGLFERVEGNGITIQDALLAITEQDIDILIKPSVVYSDKMNVIAEARVACTGAARGVLCFDLRQLSYLKQRYGSVIWVTDHIHNDDLCYLGDIAGIFALKEDPSSHAVIVTRVSNIPCLTLPQHAIIRDSSLVTPSGVYREGDAVTLDAFNGKLFWGDHSLHSEVDKARLDHVMAWAEKYATLTVHGNADTAEESRLTLYFGGKGVDPRTEHMFFHPQRLHLFRRVILSKGEDRSALQELENYQRQDFVDLYQTMRSYPVKIRLLDPPLHEFLPTDDALLIALASDLEVSFESVKRKVEALYEVNPMMGNRGVRLLLTFPEVLKMQARAIFEAALDPSLREDSIEPFIVIPMIIAGTEVIKVKEMIDNVRDEISKRTGRKIVYHLGVMIETPRACLLAEEIAPHVDFISFGTNDLTGQTLAFSRGDVYEKFLKHYLDEGLLAVDPFSELDVAVIRLLKMTVEQMRKANHPISIGICGEQASERSGVFVCHQLGFDTVSCAYTRIPVVKLFAAQAALSQQDGIAE